MGDLHASRISVTREYAAAFSVPQAQVEVHAGAGQVGAPLGHERHGQLPRPGDLLDPLLVNAVAVGHFQNVRMAQIQLVLAGSPLPLAELHGDAAFAHLTAHGAVEILLFGSLEHMVIFDVPAEGLQVIVVLLAGGFVGIFEDVVLQLGAALGAVPGFGQAL